MNLIFVSVDNCGVINGGCSHSCIDPTNGAENFTCSCEGTDLVIDPSGDTKQCSKFINQIFLRKYLNSIP